MKISLPLHLGLFLTILCSLAPARPYFNDLPVPSTLEDLRKIEATVKQTLPKIRPATVCLQMGGGSGSAVIVSEDGLVLSAAHVTGGTDQYIIAVMEDGRKIPAKSLGLNSETDSAMLQLLEPGPFPFVNMDTENTVKLGDWVIALGHSGGFDESRGSVVRLGRLVRTEQSTFQSDTVLIGGDSGGPLFDIEGNLIAIHSRVGASKEQSLHVPLQEFQREWDNLSQGQFLGTGPFAQQPEKGTGALGLDLTATSEGLLVEKVAPGSTASEVGMKKADILLSVNDLAVNDLVALRSSLAEMAPGQKVTLKWKRGEESFEESARLGNKPKEKKEAPKPLEFDLLPPTE